MERMYSIHFPSKLPEYLALGMPIVMVGPECATGVRWAIKNPQAIFLTDLAGLVRCLTDWRESPAKRAAFAVAALSASARDFDPVSLRSRFLKALANCRQEAL